MKEPYIYSKGFLVFALILAGTAVALGAFGAHGLKSVLTENQLTTFETGVRYQMYHALAILILSVMGSFIAQTKWRLGMIMLAAGTVVFSASLYAYLATTVVAFAMITPLGGSALILGWLTLAVGAWQGR